MCTANIISLRIMLSQRYYSNENEIVKNILLFEKGDKISSSDYSPCSYKWH